MPNLYNQRLNTLVNMAVEARNLALASAKQLRIEQPAQDCDQTEVAVDLHTALDTLKAAVALCEAALALHRAREVAHNL